MPFASPLVKISAACAGPPREQMHTNFPPGNAAAAAPRSFHAAPMARDVGEHQGGIRMTPVTPEQTEAILGLVAQGVDRETIAHQIGVTPGQVSAVKAVANRGKRVSEISTDEVIGDAIETTFGLERDLQRALRDHIDQLEPGLSLIDDGKERKVAAGFIDITARDRGGATVVNRTKGRSGGPRRDRANPRLHG
jgi:hypothetical protein